MSSASSETEMVKLIPIRVTSMDTLAAGGMIIIPSEVLKIITRMDLISICSSQQGRVPLIMNQSEMKL